MFLDLKERALLKAQTLVVNDNRKEAVKWLFRSVVEEALPEIESLGFVEVKLFKLDTIPHFSLKIQSRRGYSRNDCTHNLELASIKNVIYYGAGANSSRGKEMEFDYNWNNSKLVATMKDALRAMIGAALTSLEICNSKGWNKRPGE